MPRLASAMRNSRFLSRSRTSDNDFFEAIDNLVTIDWQAQKYFLSMPDNVSYTFPLKLPGIRAPFGQRYAEFTVFETRKQRLFRNKSNG